MFDTVIKELTREVIEKYCKKEDNVIYAEVVFKVMPYVKWCYDMYEEDKISDLELRKYLTVPDHIINGTLEVKWKSGVPHFDKKNIENVIEGDN